MIRISIKATTVKIFLTEYVPLEHDKNGKKIKGTGASVEKSLTSFKRNGTNIPAGLKEKLSKTDFNLLTKTIHEAHENDMRPIINQEFATLVETLLGYDKKIHLVEISEELGKKIDTIFSLIKRKRREDAKKKLPDSLDPVA